MIGLRSLNRYHAFPWQEGPSAAVVEYLSGCNTRLIICRQFAKQAAFMERYSGHTFPRGHQSQHSRENRN